MPRENPAPAAPTVRDELLDLAHARLAAGPGVLLRGPLGIGRSALLAELAARQRADGAVVLRTAPAPQDGPLPHLGLIDLFRDVPRRLLDGLPPVPRAALRAALLDGGEPPAADGRLALRVGVLTALRRLADTAPVLLAVDDLQWLDEPSAGALDFALRRLDGHPVRLLAAERADDEPRGGPAVCPPGTTELTVPPLTREETARLLAAAGVALPPPLLRAVLRTAAGNPRYALELGRATAYAHRCPASADAPDSAWFDDFPAPGGSGAFGETAVFREPGAPPGFAAFPDAAEDDGVVVPARLREVLLGRFRGLPEPVRRTLLLGAAATRPTVTLLRAAGRPGAADELAEAERRAIAAADTGGTVRFAHPVLRAAVYADATAAERRLAHAALAAAIGEPVESARHLALARPLEDETTAAVLLSAARAARERGAAITAARLAGGAARRTPRDHPADRADRWLAAADYACDAGLRAEADRIAYRVLRGARDPRQRVRARLVLLRNAGQALEGTRRLIADGLCDAAGAPELEAWLHHWAAVRGLLCGELEQAAGHARQAARQAAIAGDTGAWTAALSTLARVRSLAGAAEGARAALDQALALVGDARGGPAGWGLLRMGAVLALDADRVAEAGDELGRLLDDIGEFGAVEEVLATLVALTRVQVRAGECRLALRTAARCARIAAEAGGGTSAPALYAAALAAATGSSAAEARELAERAVRASEADGDRLFGLRALAVLGQAALLTGEPQGAAEAVEALRRVREIGDAMCAADPPMLHWYADLAEALVALGETEAAGRVLREAYERAGDRAPGSVTAALERAEGLLAAARGRAKEGVALLLSSAGRLRAAELPVDLARTLLALGAVERRARHRGAARGALAEAAAVAERAGAVPLAARAREELDRLAAGERGGGPLLTPTEARIAELVGGGATNREVAAELFISVKTVEGTLSRVYRKFGVRSRTALARALAVSTGHLRTGLLPGG